MSKIVTTYDGAQHCTTTDATKGKAVAMDCPYTGKGENFCLEIFSKPPLPGAC